MMHHGQIVGDEQIRQPEAPLQILHDVQHLRLHRNIERRGRLVAHEELRVDCERAGDRNALALPPGKLMGIAITIRGVQSNLQQQVIDPESALVGRHLRMREHRLGDDAPHAPPGVQARIRILEDHLQPLAHRLAARFEHARQGLAVECHRAARQRVEPDQQSCNRRLAAARLTDKGKGFAATDGKRDPVNRPQQRAWLAREDSLEPGSRYVEPAGGVHDFNQRAQIVAHGRGSSCNQQAARVAPAARSSGRSTVQRGRVCGQRGLNAHPGGIAVRRGIEPSI